MKRVCIRIALWFSAIGILASCFLAPLFNAARPHWPPIADPAKLRHEATILCQAAYSGEVPRADWPEGIAALHPRAVFADRESVSVMISGGGTTALAWGYIIWPDTMKRTDGGITKYDEAHDKH